MTYAWLLVSLTTYNSGYSEKGIQSMFPTYDTNTQLLMLDELLRNN